MSDLEKIIKGLRSHNELTDSPSLRAYIRETTAKNQSSNIPRPNSQNSIKIKHSSENVSTEPIKLAQLTSHRYHTSLSAARIRARSVSPTSASGRKAIKSPYTYASVLSSGSYKTKSNGSGGNYLLDSNPNRSAAVPHSFNIAVAADTNDFVPRSKSLDDIEVSSTASLQDQILSQHTDKEDVSSEAGAQQQIRAPTISPSYMVKEGEKERTPAGNISSVTTASSSAIVDTYFRSMNFSADDQHCNSSSVSSIVENRAKSPRASRVQQSFSAASESSSLDSYGVDHPNLQPERKARSNSPKRSASQEFVDSTYDTPEKRRVKTENHSSSTGLTPVRESKPMAFPLNISPSKSLSRSQSTTAGNILLLNYLSIHTVRILVSYCFVIKLKINK